MPYANPEDRTAYFARTLEHRREVHRAWVAAHHEERTLYMAHYQKIHLEDRRANSRRSYHKHREKRLEEKRQRYRAHADEICAALREKRQMHLEETRHKDRERRAREGPHIDALARARHLANPEPRRASDRKRRTNPARKVQAQTSKRQRRAAKNNAPVNNLTHAQWLEIQAAQDHRCYYCGKRCKGKLTQDHIQALSQGGSHTLHNVIGACKSCNCRKGTRPPPKPVQPLLLTMAPAKKPQAS